MFYQTEHFFVGLLRWPGLHLNMLAKSSEFDVGPIILKRIKVWSREIQCIFNCLFAHLNSPGLWFEFKVLSKSDWDLEQKHRNRSFSSIRLNDLPIFCAPDLGIINEEQLILTEIQTRQNRFWAMLFRPSFICLLRNESLLKVFFFYKYFMKLLDKILSVHHCRQYFLLALFYHLT